MAVAFVPSVPLAWRNLVASPARLVRSAGGIGFAVLLMLMQLGFEEAFFNASLEIVRHVDGDLILQKASKYRFVTRDPFPSAELDKAKRVAGVASAAGGGRGARKAHDQCLPVVAVLVSPSAACSVLPPMRESGRAK